MTGLTIAISAGLAVAGAGTEMYANNQALNKQDQQAAAGIMAQGALRNKANADVQTNITQAKNNQSNITNNQADLQAQYDAALNRGASVQGTQGALPGASKRFAADTTAALAANSAYGKNQAATAAAVGAPALTNMQTQEGLGNTATQLGQLSDQSNQQNQLTQLEVNSITANPWMMAAGAALQGASKGYGSMAGFNGAGATSAGQQALATNAAGNAGQIASLSPSYYGNDVTGYGV